MKKKNNLHDPPSTPPVTNQSNSSFLRLPKASPKASHTTTSHPPCRTNVRKISLIQASKSLNRTVLRLVGSADDEPGTKYYSPNTAHANGRGHNRLAAGH
ncbi:uncharacterized protein BDR25DRAFT_352117 [Lindgomyces ingoldianus]|uniref:Uncharacterized protein n=1 Tax=Lindgomyces ingoldianus TaxID=673940 RepID=A0ACB6R378_9PLEO|nr:uncharacterized protein BDR25DRAFT_352117 [Lindgomyces ingoldianus]KAF2473626.1 hypothetical protein BDR25DRAFT_352117 [Lindgomyces ingoldianus]